MPSSELLPADDADATLVGRVWDPAQGGPCVVRVAGDVLVDLSARFPTAAAVWAAEDPAAAARDVGGPVLCALDDLAAQDDPAATGRPRLLSPIDLQVVKAAGVTFPSSLWERVVEERAGGDLALAEEVRERLTAELGAGVLDVRPGSPEAAHVKRDLVARGLWSQYLEVALGPDAEVFTKAAVLSTVGHGARIGVLAASEWSNSEPEVVLAVDARGRVVGAALGNDVNLRDVEGRSALLLPRAKDNNASAAVGPFVRLFDDGYGMDDVERAVVRLRVEGEDGFTMEDSCHLDRIRRRPADLVAQAIGSHHQYPDGLVLFLGTMVAPTADRDRPGMGFTHRPGDVVTISEERLGTLRNVVGRSEELPPWEFGLSAFMANLAERGLLAGRTGA